MQGLYWLYTCGLFVSNSTNFVKLLFVYLFILFIYFFHYFDDLNCGYNLGQKVGDKFTKLSKLALFYGLFYS